MTLQKEDWKQSHLLEKQFSTLICPRKSQSMQDCFSIVVFDEKFIDKNSWKRCGDDPIIDIQRNWRSGEKSFVVRHLSPSRAPRRKALVTGLRNECSPSFLRDGNYLIIMSSPTDLWAISIHHPWSQKLQIMYFAIKKSLKGTRYVFLSPAVIIRSLALISVRDTIRTENYVHFLTLDQFVGFIIFRMNAGNLLKLQ